MPANFTEEQRKVIRNSLLTIGYDLIREVGLKKMKVSLIAERAEIATGTFYHFFESKETYVSALIEEQEKVWKEQMISGSPPPRRKMKPLQAKAAARLDPQRG